MRKIIDLPDQIDPVVLITQEISKCPFCKVQYDTSKFYHTEHMFADKNGKNHYFLRFLNKYQWNRIKSLSCPKCGCKWDTGWYPVDHKMFEIVLDKETMDIINKDKDDKGILPKVKIPPTKTVRY